MKHLIIILKNLKIHSLMDIMNLKTDGYLLQTPMILDFETQFYYLAHNIRNAKTNPIHNRMTFEKRNYNPNQLQFNF